MLDIIDYNVTDHSSFFVKINIYFLNSKLTWYLYHCKLQHHKSPQKEFLKGGKRVTKIQNQKLIVEFQKKMRAKHLKFNIQIKIYQ